MENIYDEFNDNEDWSDVINAINDGVDIKMLDNNGKEFSLTDLYNARENFENKNKISIANVKMQKLFYSKVAAIKNFFDELKEEYEISIKVADPTSKEKLFDINAITVIVNEICTDDVEKFTNILKDVESIDISPNYEGDKINMTIFFKNLFTTYAEDT